MNRPHSHRPAPLMVLLLMLVSSLEAQEAESDNTAQKDPGTPASSSGQEVEVNEDVYRRFMELRDARQQRIILPEEVFKASSGLQKLEELPEESQKHLRNQLREIIVSGAEWQPGDENKQNAYVPSAAAAANPELQKKEAEAWGELLDSYHKREAQIYQNSARSQAAMASQGEMTGNSSGQQGSSGGGQAQDGEQASQQSPQNEQSPGEASPAIPRTASVTRSSSSSGVSQNAMEFLERMGTTGGPVDSVNQAEDGNNEDTGSESGVGGPLNEPTPVTSDTEQLAETARMADIDSDQANERPTKEDAQSALDYLAKHDESTGDKDESSDESPPGENEDSDKAGQQVVQDDGNDANTTIEKQASAAQPSNGEGTVAGASQNAMEYLRTERIPVSEGITPGEAEPAVPGGTLSIEDLVNARGVGQKPVPPGGVSGNAPGQPAPKIKPKKKEEDG